jgi:hypothetical protein
LRHDIEAKCLKEFFNDVLDSVCLSFQEKLLPPMLAKDKLSYKDLLERLGAKSYPSQFVNLDGRRSMPHLCKTGGSAVAF